MDIQPQALKLIFLWTCLAIGLSAMSGATASGHEASPASRDVLHRSKRTMTTICVEIRPSSPQDEPYYMCRGASFGGDGSHQSCVEVRNQGGQGEPFYMCRGAESTGPAAENQPSMEHMPPPNPQPAVHHDSGHNFPVFPAFEGGSYPQQPATEDSTRLHQVQPAGPSSYQEELHRQPVPQQHQPHAQYGFYGGPMAAPPTAPPAQSAGVPELHNPTLGSPPAAPSGVSAGPGPASTASPYDPAAFARTPSRPKENEVAGSGGHRFTFDDDVLTVPDVGFRREELQQQYRRPVNQPRVQDQLMWVPLSQTQDPQSDPVIKAFYSSLAVEGHPAQEAPVGSQDEPMVGQMAPGYSPYNSQYPEAPAPPTLPPPPPTYSQAEVAPAPNTYCNGCSPTAPPIQCPTPLDNGVSYSTTCPSFQPVIISMPCYAQRPPTPYFGLPRAAPALAPAGPFGGGFGLGAQLGSPFGMTPQMGGQGYDMEHQVGGPFGMGMQLGMGMNPFGPFGALNPFNPFNRMLGAQAPNPPPQNGNFFQRVFQFDQNAAPASTTEAAPATEAQSERSGKLNFSSSTPASPSSEQPDSIVSDDLESEEDVDPAEDIDKEEDPAVTTPLPASEADESADVSGVPAIVSKATDLLKPMEKRKRHRQRSSGRGTQKHRYLQQL
ncbi:extensin [Drosophila teissieri]|uniref:extensin n=1 Tax=Drosophila teissieri TaxID=7243 RepID=UPI001CBA4F92|nr:extensin [Drosophila teissieri]XP_043658549.1 extensin [Drosophila teissieri]XP_043658557.1 extensin [Drosophila teissieri]